MSRKSIRLKIFLARLLVVVMVVTSIPFYQKQEAKAAGNLLWPVSGGKLGCGFNCSCATHRGYHNGIDINGVPEGTSIMAAESGVVICSNNTTSGRTEKCNRGCQGQGNGHHVEIKHANGMITQYNHMSRVDVSIGQSVTRGQVIGAVGQTGNAYGAHLHFVVSIGGRHTAWSGTGNRVVNPLDYLGGSNPQPVANASIQAVSCDKYDNNLVPRAKVYNPNGQRVTTVGITIRDNNNVIASKQETMKPEGQYSHSSNIWFDCRTECGVTLRPGHVYNWQIYANVGGKTLYTDWIYDRTTGTEKPNTPAFSTTKTHYAVGDAVTVNWGADSNATGGYSLTITQTKGGTYTKTLTTSTANATSLAFALPSAGEYKITGFARGSSNSDVATLNKTIVAHDPCKVRFVEFDKDGKENLLCEQTVKYGYAATAPLGISRKGYTFLGWKGEYSNVTSDRTIEAQFKRNTYKITFCDKDDKVIKSESVLFEDSATAPEPPEAEKGYVFAGWDSEDYKNVQGNATIKATYVWANDDLPVVITLNKCEFKDDGYIVNYDIKNNPNKRTKGRALVSLKTSKGKLLDSTESKAFSLGKGEEKKGIEIYVPYEGAATKADLYIINGFSKGIPISEVATIDVARNWSEWSPEKPDDNNEIETRTEYRHQDKETTTTRTNANAGWTLDKSVLDGDWNYGAWSGWTRNSISGYTNETSKREVQTQNVQDSAARTLYNWYYYRYYNTNAKTFYYTYSSSMGGTRYDWQTDYCLPVIGTYSGHTGYKPAGGKNFSAEIWFLASTQNIAASSHTEWRYRDATKGYTYYWSRWKDWTEWSTNEAKESNTSKVETRTAYRYRAKMEDVEDNSGKSYTVSGTLDKELAGKQATLLVYKNDEPSDSNNEYVGQVAIGEDGSYAYTFIPRQAISAKTGDYTVALAIEGAENPVFLEKIIAPKPEYTVTFKDDEGNIIDTQKVMEGSSATSPKVPDKEHYSFVGWDFGFTNVRDDMEITAQYVKNKYSVAYVNWETKEAETKVFSYGDPLDYSEESVIEGYDFVGWTTLDGKKVNEVTDNLVLMANYKIQTYTINFYDKNEKLINSQKVEYGKDAIEPEHEDVDKMDFKGWNTYGFIQVKSDLDVYPVYVWKETTETPSCDTKSGVFTEATKVKLSAEKDATIYYTTDGTTPNVFSNKYTGELTISANTYLQFVAVAPQKNMSEVQAVSFLVASGEDDQGALVVKKEKYKMDRGSETKITYFLSHDNPNIGVNFYSLDDNIATVAEDGTVHANNVGTTQVFVSTKDNKYADYCEIEVTTDDVDVESISLNKTSVTGIKNETIQMQATVYPENATDQEVDWYVDDNSVASITDQGELTILKKGTTKLRAYAKSGTCIAECDVQGLNEYQESKLQMSTQYMYLYENDLDILYAYYNDAAVECTWTSQNEDVATVKDGVITAKKEGHTVITATAEDGTQVTSMVIVSKEKLAEPGASPEPTESAKPTESVKPTESAKPTVTPVVTPGPTADASEEPQVTPTPTVSPSTQPTVTPSSSPTIAPSNKPVVQPTKRPNYKKPVVKAPAKVKGVKVKNLKGRKLKVSWSWDITDGYQIQYAMNRKFTKKKKTVTLNALLSKKTFKHLKKNKTYYVRVRAFRESGNVKKYGKWSTVKKIKIKK